jgi:hypothetical protein
MKLQKLTFSNSIRTLLLTVPVISSTAFAACSDLSDTAATHSTLNFQSSAVRTRHADDYVTVGPRYYYSKDQTFERPWPFGPEYNPQ